MTRNQPHRVALWISFAFLFAFPTMVCRAVEIEVPASKLPLRLAVPMEKTFHTFRTQVVALREKDAPPAQGVVAFPAPAVAEDGTPDENRVLLMATVPPADRKRTFEVLDSSMGGNPFEFEEVEGKSLLLKYGNKPYWQYNYGLITRDDLPESERRRTRGCYLHPLFGIDGEVMTADFPKDHYHHHGIFWTWPHVKIEGEEKEYDLWTDRGIQQRFVKILGKHPDIVGAVLGVENGWFVGDRKVMIERIWMRSYHETDGFRVLDLEMIWIPVDRAITLRGAANKSYGGLTVRFDPPGKPGSRHEASTITSPDGVAEGDLPETAMPWADFSSLFGDREEKSGAAIFIPKSHPDYPPTWLARHYGAMCVGWPGVKDRQFPPGKPIHLEYRLLVHDGILAPEKLRQLYDAYLVARKAKAVESNETSKEE
jgi:hypothetical protein